MKIDLTKGITFKQIDKIKQFFMTQEEIITGNILIAEATGWKFNQTEETRDMYPMGYWVKGDDKDWCKAEDFEFHSDWNWLMGAYIELGLIDCSTEIKLAWDDLINLIKEGL